MKEYSNTFSELSGHSGSKEYESMAHLLFSFAGWTYEKRMDQQYTDPIQARIEKASSAFYRMVAHLMNIGGTSQNAFSRLFHSLVVPMVHLCGHDSAPKET